MTVTARYLIQGALKHLKVLDPIETIEPEDAADGLDTLNDMVDAWAVDSLYVLATQKVSATFSGQSATIGIGGTFNTALPVRINHAFFRRNDEDRELHVVDGARYDAIALKSLSNEFPTVLYYRRTLPLGAIAVWPVPGLTTYFLDVAINLSEFAALDTVYDVGPGYRNALKLALAEQLAPLYEKPVGADLRRNIARAKRSLKRANLVVPTADIETPFRNGRSSDVVSGTFPYP
jgi:hypothetical protein